jgi:hypothetical protein
MKNRNPAGCVSRRDFVLVNLRNFFPERLDFVEKREKFTQNYQGEAFRTYLARRFADKRAEETLKSNMDQFLEAAALPEQFRWLGRIRRLFAVA